MRLKDFRGRKKRARQSSESAGQEINDGNPHSFCPSFLPYAILYVIMYHSHRI